MIEIGARVDLSHPPQRVWRALTDRELLARWFVEVDAGPGERLLLHTAGLPGFEVAVDAEVVERRAPESLALRCDEAGRRSRLSCVVVPTAEGCRLSVTETLEQGAWPAGLHADRERHHEQALTVRLPAILDWLAFREVDLRRGEGAATAELPLVPAYHPPRRGRRRAVVWTAAAVVGILVAGAVAVWAVLPDPPQRAAGVDPLPPPVVAGATSRPARASGPATPGRSVGAATARPSRSASPRASRTPAPVTPPPGVSARYETASTRLFGWTGEVVLDNPGDAPATGWTVVVTLAASGTVTGASGADWRQDGRTVAFTGTAVPAGRSRTISFDVRDADPLSRSPRGCTVDGDPCAGL
ncbi:SRPBCC domain-containing protein [Micromonospora citrea]|uniref:SRPBCC domain-containing protein n=1 Tax=Micromonospora citrea TaxID=47855 RepID=UPI003C3817EF